MHDLDSLVAFPLFANMNSSHDSRLSCCMALMEVSGPAAQIMHWVSPIGECSASIPVINGMEVNAACLFLCLRPQKEGLSGYL